jgi:hypothetical protein
LETPITVHKHFPNLLLERYRATPSTPIIIILNSIFLMGGVLVRMFISNEMGVGLLQPQL